MKKRGGGVDGFLRDLERVTTLQGLFKPGKPLPTLKEVRPGVFVRVDDGAPAPVNPIRKLRETLAGLDLSDKAARDLGEQIRKQVR